MISYWEKRKAREAFQMYKNVEEASEELTRLYVEASDEITEEVRRLFRRFQIKNGLSEKTALRLLNASPDKLPQLLRPFNKELAEELERQRVQLNRLGQIQKNVDAVTSHILMSSEPAFKKTFESVAFEAYYRELFALQQRANAGFLFNPMTAERVADILNRNWSGESYSERLWKNTAELAQTVKRELVKGMLTGKTPFKMSQTIQEKFHSGASASRRLMRTESNYVANQVTLDAYKEADVEKYIYVAILDLRTSEICRSLDKKRFLLSNAEVGVNYPPMHPWCRSTTIAWMPDNLLKQLQQSAIDPNTGERIKVPADMTYDEWYNKFVVPKETETLTETPTPIDGFVQGEPMTFERANTGNVNPHYKESAGYRINCQSCVPVYEARRRGYDIEALPKTSEFQQQLAKDRSLAWIDPATGKHPVIPRSGTSSAKGFEKYMNENMTDDGRYALAIARRSSSGHIVTAERRNGEVWIYDLQTGRSTNRIADWLKYEGAIYSWYGRDYSPVLFDMSKLNFDDGVLGKIAKKK